MQHNPVDDLPIALYRAEQVRELDRLAIEQQGIPGFTLMRRAGKAAFDVLLAAYPEVEKITVLCGTGNNGGDGYVIATLARQHGIPVRVVQCGDAGKIKGDALQARQHALQDGVEIIDFSDALEPVTTGVIVDALLGTGLSGDVRGAPAAAIQWVNVSSCPVLAVDIPSGLCSDTGRVLGDAIKAGHTVSFIGLKQGLLTGAGPDFSGRIHFDALQVSAAVFEQLSASSERLDLTQLQKSFPARSPSDHKGRFGHVLIVGGDLGMAGATVMASQAACRIGAGLTSCATRAEHIAALISRCPEVMARAVVSGQELEPLLDRASVVVIGPGLGQRYWGEQLLQRVLQCDLPMVVDADALNLLSRMGDRTPYRENWILTPHPGEAARLLDCSVAEVQQDRFAAVQALQSRYGGAIILKGAGSLVADAEHAAPGLCPYGNPGMATGGMGDVLSGVLGSLLAQGLSVAGAARLGACLHASAADCSAAVDGPRGMLATDLIPYLRKLVN